MSIVLRRGFINPWIVFVCSAALLTVLLGFLFWNPDDWFSSIPTKERLIVYCAAGLRPPVEAVAKEYEEKFGVPIEIQYGGSQTLLAQIDVTKRGDIYIPADDSFISLAQEKGLIAEILPLAEMKPVLAVPQGNPLSLHNLTDLLQQDIRLAMGNSQATAIGAVVKARLLELGMWDAIQERTVVFKMTVNDVANDVQVGAVDAGIIWDATARQTPGIDYVSIDSFSETKAHVSATILTTSTQPTAALRFARYLSARDRGLRHFHEHGYETVLGDIWAEVPELRLLCGAMLRPAIEDTLTAFEQREGCRITRVYNGCGILVAHMKAGEIPDAYFACDKSFMDEVADLFADQQDISMNQLVIIVPKGNPHGITSLKDLSKPGLRVGIGHEKQCALGVLTQRTFREGRVQEDVMKNVKVQTPTGDMLVNQLRTGSLDAIVAYISNAAAAGDQLEAIAIDMPCALAVQPLAASKHTNHKYITGRLIDAIRSAESKERFLANGFRWQVQSP